MSKGSKPRVVVVGGGVTGLATAYYTKKLRPDCALTLVESKARLGGNILTVERDGFLLDGGPDSFLRTKPAGVALCRELGLAGEFIGTRTEGRNVYFVHGGKLERLPAGLLLGVPTRLGPMLNTPLLSWPGKLRALVEVILPKGYGQRQPGADESLHRFIERRLGGEMAERIAAPLLSGIFAGDAKELSVRATFPQLCRLEELHGGLIRGFFASQATRDGTDKEASLREIWRWLNREAQNPQSPFVSFRGGMGVLVEALASRLEGSLRVGVAAKALVQTPAGPWQLTLDGGEVLEAEAVVLTTAAHVSARLLGSGDSPGHKGLPETLASVPYRSTATVFFALDRDQVHHPLDGLGFMSDGSDSLIAGTWVSSKWEHRAPPGKVLIRGFLGGSEQVEQSSDDELVERAKAGLERLMGPLGQPLFTRVFRHVRASPQLLVGHPARVASVRRKLEAARGLYLAGAAFEGIGIPDCIAQARTQSAALVKELC